ncbi:hypothetical protein BGW41_005086 [Actinomortierella wolfii]|nr:hypothetical protein BGW41_005086 [Actinomortierella wolfii]
MSIWFDGPVAQAVSTANSKQCILLVCILQGGDEVSSQYEARFAEEPLVTALATLDLVALKVMKESQDGVLFGQVYPIMSVPAVYLIRNGLLVDFLPAHVEPTQMLERIQKAVQGHFAIPPPPGTLHSTTGATAPATSSSNAISPVASSPASTPALVPAAAAASPSTPPQQQQNATAAVSTSESTNPPTSSSSTSVSATSVPSTEPTSSSTSNQESVKEKLKKLQEERRIQREKEEREAAKKRELERRANSKALQEAQSELKEKEARKLKEKIEREKREEAEYRKKLKQQLEEDKQRRRAEREKAEQERLAAAAAAKRDAGSPPTGNGAAEVLTPSEVRSQNSGLWNARNDASSSLACESTRLNVRLFDGSSIRNVFQAVDTLSTVRQWIDQNRGEDNTPYNIVQVIPPRTFTDEEKSLRDLDLCPSATLVLKPIVRSADAYGGSGGGAVSSLMGLGWSALSLAGKAASAAYNTVAYYNPLRESNAASSSSVYGDSHSSSSSSSARAKKDDDDDRDKRRTTTYNGNSTSLE